jgi:hypothetical protein
VKAVEYFEQAAGESYRRKKLFLLTSCIHIQQPGVTKDLKSNDGRVARKSRSDIPASINHWRVDHVSPWIRFRRGSGFT